MNGISTEELKEIRNEFKREFPQYNFWTTSKRWPTAVVINVSIMSGPMDLTKEYPVIYDYNDTPQVIDSNYCNQPEMCEFLNKVLQIGSRYRKIVSKDGDGTSVPNYHISIMAGNFSKRYKLIPTKRNKKTTI